MRMHHPTAKVASQPIAASRWTFRLCKVQSAGSRGWLPEGAFERHSSECEQTLHAWAFERRWHETQGGVF